MRCLLLIAVPGLVEALAPHWSREWAERAGKTGRVSRRVRRPEWADPAGEEGRVSR